MIEERFQVMTGPNAGYTGRSYSVYNKATTEWKQTWVDNSGAYLDFKGNLLDQNPSFERSFISSDGKETYQRMVFHDIAPSSLTWDWEKSTDGGKSWQLAWRIYYRRVQQ